MSSSVIQRNPFVKPAIPPANSHRNIELWNQAVKENFSPFVRRKRILKGNRKEFRTELMNLFPILQSGELIDALLDAVRMCRKSIYRDSAASHSHQIAHFEDTSRADGHWLSLCASSRQLDPDAGLEDKVSFTLRQIDSVIEGCLKPHLRSLFGFAHFLAHGNNPTRVRDIGECVADWPRGIAPKLAPLMKDKNFGISISQWRNIAAHRTHARIDSTRFRATYGKKVKKTVEFDLAELERIFEWSRGVLAVCRMANVITYLEFMSELHCMGLPNVPVRFDAFMISLAHSLRTVGFTYAAERRDGHQLAVLFEDDLCRESRHAIIHLSQVLDEVALVSNSDVALRDVVKRVAVALVSKEKTAYASAAVDVNVALQWLSRRLSQKKYVSKIDFWIGATSAS
jgi:hypothetical protein